MNCKMHLGCCSKAQCMSILCAALICITVQTLVSMHVQRKILEGAIFRVKNVCSSYIGEE